jgi:hypothetical protein
MRLLDQRAGGYVYIDPFSHAGLTHGTQHDLVFTAGNDPPIHAATFTA